MQVFCQGVLHLLYPDVESACQTWERPRKFEGCRHPSPFPLILPDHRPPGPRLAPGREPRRSRDEHRAEAGRPAPRGDAERRPLPARRTRCAGHGAGHCRLATSPVAQGLT